MLGGGRAAVNTRSFKNDMRNLGTKDDVLTLLVYLGYLAYDSGNREAFIPNREIAEEFENAMGVGGWPEVMRVLKASQKFLEVTINGEVQRVAEALDRVHTEGASMFTYNDENSLAAAIGLAYYSARQDYVLIRDFPSGKGFADVVFLPLPHSCLIERVKYSAT